MNWKEEVSILEEEGKWDEAITFMQKVIADNPDNTDGYIFINFLLQEYC